MRPIPASTVIVVTDQPDGLQVLMVRRADAGPFADVYVFPGGKVDPADGLIGGGADPDEAWRLAGLRELAEETGLVVTRALHPIVISGLAGGDLYRALEREGLALETDRLKYLSNWVTPEGVLPYRFDTRFYVLELPEPTPPVIDNHEVVEAVWIRPEEGLDRVVSGAWGMILPTMQHLEFLKRIESVADLREALEDSERLRLVRPTMDAPVATVDRASQHRSL